MEFVVFDTLARAVRQLGYSISEQKPTADVQCGDTAYANYLQAVIACIFAGGDVQACIDAATDNYCDAVMICNGGN